MEKKLRMLVFIITVLASWSILLNIGIYKDDPAAGIYYESSSKGGKSVTENVKWNRTLKLNYYTPRKTKVNPIEHKFMIIGSQICKSVSPFILIIVPSVPSHFENRDVIRNTYGLYARFSGAAPAKFSSNIGETVELLFIMGRDGNQNTDYFLEEESRMYGDIVQADFVDSYFNLTRKILVGLKWTSTYCRKLQYLLKIDEDVFINLPVLAGRLREKPFNVANGSIYGYIYKRGNVRRDGKWRVSHQEFPLAKYPSYASGNSYVISGNIIPRLFWISEYFPYLPIEDALITGILARVIMADQIHLQGFTTWETPEPDPCSFVKKKRISATNLNNDSMIKLWRASQAFDVYCHST